MFNQIGRDPVENTARDVTDRRDLKTLVLVKGNEEGPYGRPEKKSLGRSEAGRKPRTRSLPLDSNRLEKSSIVRLNS